MATDTFICTANSGSIFNQSATYLTARSGGGSFTLDGTFSTAGQRFSTPNYRFYEGFGEWDLSSISASATVSAVAMRMCDSDQGLGDDQTFQLNVRAYDYGVALATGDFVAGASISAKTLLAHMASTAFTDGTTPRTFTNDAGFVAAVQAALGGNFRVMISSDRGEAGTTPTQFEYCSPNTYTGGAGTNWELDVTYTLPTAAPRATCRSMRTLRSRNR